MASATSADSGAQFRCVVSNAYGSATSNAATLTVSGSGHPTATITSPTQGTLYTGGMSVTYAGTASDTEDGALPPSAFTWQVDFHHDSHVHPFLPATTGASGGTFTIPRTGETSTNVWYRIHLSVTDSSGQTFSTFRATPPGIAAIDDGV